MQIQKYLLLFSIIAAILAVFFVIVCSILKEDRIPNALQPQKIEDGTPFDYIIVGAGTAGSVLAALLAQNSDYRILLIEAGGQFGLLSKIPLLATFQQKGVNDWGFLSEKQQYSSKGLYDQRQCLPRGKGLGGSSELNYMVHFDGYAKDLERWTEIYNLTDWNYEKVKPFLNLAGGQPSEILNIDKSYSKLTEAFHNAKFELEESRDWKFRFARYHIKKGLRNGVYQRFLKPSFQHKNLVILNNVMAKAIVLNQTKKVEGLLISLRDPLKKGKEKVIKIHVNHELIVSAGAYQSPQLLLASGIGDKTELMKIGKECIHDLPFVGKNLHDHLNQPLFVSIDEVGPTLNSRSILFDPISLFNYITSGGGHLGNFGVLAFVDALDKKYPGSKDNTSFGLTLFGAGAIDESALMSISNFKPKYFRALFPRYHNSSQEGFVLISTCLQPKSRGTVRIRNDNVRKPPLIDPNYLSESYDVNCTLCAIRAAVEIVTKTKGFLAMKSKIHWPQIEECRNLVSSFQDFKRNEPSDEYLECLIRHVALGSHHPGGTCRMGNNPSNSVVDSSFKVHGIHGLRIVDASIFTTPVSGNPNTMIIAMAIRATTMILKDAIDRNNERN